MSQSKTFEHVVVLMMENHSFDRMLGWLPGVGELNGSQYNAADPTDTNSERYYVRKGAGYTSTPDPAHDLADVNYQLFGQRKPNENCRASNAWFVNDYMRQISPGNGRELMDCFSPDQLPALSTLAREFTCLRRWFASVPGPTGPNRLFAHCATSGGYAGDQYELDAFEIDVTSDSGTISMPYDLNTIYQNLMNEGKSWRIYWEDFSTAMTQKQLWSHSSCFAHLEDFFEDVANKRLANYTFLTPRLCPGLEGQPPTSQHPSYDVRPGDDLIADVYESIRNQPEIWERTLLIITYDEHGGFFDSVNADFPAINPDGKNYGVPPGFDFTRLGVRVPAVVVSAYTERGVNDQVFDHTSIAATLKDVFNLPTYLTKRDAAANSLLPCCGLLHPRADTPNKLPRAGGALTIVKDMPIHGMALHQVNHFKKLIEEHHDAAHPLLSSSVTTQAEAGAFLRKACYILLGKP